MMCTVSADEVSAGHQVVFILCTVRDEAETT